MDYNYNQKLTGSIGTEYKTDIFKLEEFINKRPKQRLFEQ